MSEQDNHKNDNITVSEEGDERRRFLIEWEFVQCLANPKFLHYLAQQGFMEDEAFLQYLRYLHYWQSPPYLDYILYPACLAYLELLQDADFRLKLKRPEFQEYLHRQQFYHWQFHRWSRTLDALQGTPPPPPPPSGSVSAPKS